MMRRALLLLACVGGAAAIHSVTLDTAGQVAATDALGAGSNTDGAGVIQGVNLPWVMSDSLGSEVSSPRRYEGDSAGRLGNFMRTTKETYFKAYVKCAGLSSSTSTYSLTYTLDGLASATVGTGYSSTSNPFVMVEGLDDGMHTLAVTCTVRRPARGSTRKPKKTSAGAGFAARGARGRERTAGLVHARRWGTSHRLFGALIINPARVVAQDSSGVDESYPLTFNWKVDTTTSSEVVFDNKPDYYHNSLSPSFEFHSTIPSSAAVSGMVWTCNFQKDGTDEDEAFAACDGGNGVSSSDTPTATEEATWEFVAKLTITYDTTCSLTDYYCTDLDNKVDRNSYTFRIDTTAPEVDVTSSPSAKSQYTAGKTATFEFECPSSEISCSFACLVDGYDSADATSSSRSKGSFACTSPVVITVANTTTHSFAVQATDAASNTGSWTSLYMFYADGTPPTIEFTKMDDSESYTAQQLASGATYYASSNDYNIATGGRLYKADGTTFAALDETNLNAADESWTEGWPHGDDYDTPMLQVSTTRSFASPPLSRAHCD